MLLLIELSNFQILLNNIVLQHKQLQEMQLLVQKTLKHLLNKLQNYIVENFGMEQ